MRTKKITVPLLLIAITIIWLFMLLSGCKKEELKPECFFRYETKGHFTIQYYNESKNYNHACIDYGDGNSIDCTEYQSIDGLEYSFKQHKYPVIYGKISYYNVTVTVYSNSKELSDSHTINVPVKPPYWNWTTQY